MGRIIGIDLGTTYSCVAYFNEKKGIFEVLPSKQGQQTTPSVVSVNKGGEVVVGETAKRQALIHPENTVAEIKRHMGELGPDGKPYAVRFAGREHTPEEISAYILRELKEAAERALNEPVTAAVITVPAYFEEPQRQATMRAGRMAGLDVKRIINEPTAAAIAYGHDHAKDEDEDEDADTKPERLVIYDLGGGTFDVSVIEVEKGNVRVRSTHGDHYLGGVDFDRAISAWAVRQIRARYGVDLEAIAAARGKDGERGRKALDRLRLEAEAHKKALSSQAVVNMSFAALVVDPASGDVVDVELDLTRADFEEMIAGKINDTLKSVDIALADAKMKVGDVDEVILVGGSTRIPLVKRVLTAHFGKEPRTDIHPDLCVAMGAAHEALKHVDVSRVPAEQRAAYEEKLEAAPLVVDVTGHSLGVAVQGTYMSVLIPKQSPIPANVTQSYTTSADNQTVVHIQPFQGEHKLVAHNTALRSFHLEGLPRLPASQVKIDVTFLLDANGMLTITAKDTMTGRQREIVIEDVHVKTGMAEAKLLPSADRNPPAGGAPAAAAPEAAGPTVLMPERYRKFVEQAKALLPKLAGDPAARLRSALDAMLEAVLSNDPRAVESAGNALMETLFDVRP
ncbi:MAG: Hsp70 family protein [Minicystis sp.]